MKRAPLSERMEMVARLASPDLVEVSERLWSHPDIKLLFPSFLYRLHCESRASIRLMETAVNIWKSLPDEPAASSVIDFLGQLIIEEQGHDEWLLDGLEVMGVSREQAWARTPPATVAELVGAQYYWMYHHHPIALLGYIKVVERNPASEAQIDRVVKRTDLPREAFAYHYGHAELELKHNDNLDILLDSLPEDGDLESLMGISAARTTHLLTRTLDEILILHEERVSRFPVAVGSGARAPQPSDPVQVIY